jgi:hypothetical protein
MPLGLVPIATPTHPHGGAYCVPDGGMDRAALIFHGNGKHLYSGPSRFPAEPRLAAGSAVLAFNRRGHGVIHSNGHGWSGGAERLVSEMIDDDAIAAARPQEQDFPSPVVIGTAKAGCSLSRTSRPGRTRLRSAAARPCCVGRAGPASCRR